MSANIAEANQVEVPWHISENQGELLNVLGTSMRVKLTGSHTGPTFSILDVEVPPGANVPLHTHAEAEVFYITSGELEFVQQAANGAIEVRSAGAGDTVVIPRQSPHGFGNVSREKTRMLVVCEPGLQAFFMDAGRGSAITAPPTPEQIRRTVSIAQRHGLQFTGV